MSTVRSITAQIPAVDPRSIRDIEQEIRDELEFHLQMRTEENVRLGLPALEARAAAVDRFGNLEKIIKACRKAQLGERIMLQRFQTALTLILIVAVVALGYQAYVAQRANREALAGVTEQLARLANAPSAASAPDRQVTPPAWDAERPRVVETIPANGVADVDPATAEIRVTFDKQMADGSWSWVRSSPESFPESTGEVYYLADMKTCVMPVQLKPGTKYVVWFNSANYQNFKDRDGRPAVPHLLTFNTRK